MNNVVDFNYIMSCSFYFDAEKNKALKKLIAKALRIRTHYLFFSDAFSFFFYSLMNTYFKS